MARYRMTGRARGALAVVAAAGALVPLTAGAGPAGAATPQVVCTSDRAGLAAKLAKDITAALRGRPATTALALRDPATDTTCTLRPDQQFDSASVVKVTVLATLLWDAKKHNRYLTQREADLSTAMITKSDNDATTTLWRQLGRTKVKAFLLAAGMSKTVPGSGGYWGLTRITARDEQKLLALVTNKNPVLSDNSRAYILKLMNKVVASQRWGTPAGAPAGTKIHVKNGWLPRATHGWRVHSIGVFTGGGRSYTMSVLTHGNGTMKDGVSTIEAVARAVHKNLNPGADPATLYVPTRTPQESIPAVPRPAPGSDGERTAG